MYIQPNTNIKLLHNVPLDSTYDHTIYFASVNAQTSYFSGLTKYNLTGYTYQRVNNHTMKVGICADNIYDCNYLMFQNSSFGNKWFYAFIKEVNYINNDVAEVVYEMDDIQTWFFDFDFDECFVEREHTETDNMFEHFEPEPVETGEYVYLNQKRLIKQNLCVMVQSVEVDNTGSSPTYATDGKTYDGVYCGCTLKAFRPDDITSINRYIDSQVIGGHPENIVSIYMCPLPYGWNDVEVGGEDVPDGSYGKNAPVTGNYDNNLQVSSDAYLGSLGYEGQYNPRGYKPKNKKLYTYPYNFAIVTNNVGSSMALRYELSKYPNNGGKIDLRYYSTITQPVQSLIRPVNYKEVDNSNEPGYDTGRAIIGEAFESISINQYPMCSWSYDAFKTWLAKETVPTIINATGYLADVKFHGGFGKKDTPSPVGHITNLLTDGYRASIASDFSKGNANCVTPMLSTEALTYVSARCTITAQYAKRIDDFFTMFGYNVNVLKKPKRNNRPHWTYIKTVSCCILGSLPSDSARHICEIHDKGITYWVNGSEIGDYSLDNSPT